LNIPTSAATPPVYSLSNFITLQTSPGAFSLGHLFPQAYMVPVRAAEMFELNPDARAKDLEF
jgi:hypothetical protein